MRPSTRRFDVRRRWLWLAAMVLAATLLPTAPAAAAQTKTFKPTGKRGHVVYFKVKGVAPSRITSAQVIWPRTTLKLNVSRVRGEAGRGTVSAAMTPSWRRMYRGLRAYAMRRARTSRGSQRLRYLRLYRWAGAWASRRKLVLRVDTPEPNGGTPRTGPPSGSLLWRGDLSGFRSGALPPFAPAFYDSPWNIYGGGSVSVASDPEKGKVLRAFGAANQSRDGSQRAEQVPTRLFHPGETVWLGFDFWVDPDLGVSNTWQGPWQLKTGPNEGYPTMGVAVAANGVNALRINSNGEDHNIGPVPRGRWTRLVIGIHLSSNPSYGWVEGWRDGQNVVPRNSWNPGRNLDGGSGSTIWAGGREHYMKLGLYRGRQPFAAEFRFANMALGTSKDSVD